MCKTQMKNALVLNDLWPNVDDSVETDNKRGRVGKYWLEDVSIDKYEYHAWTT